MKPERYFFCDDGHEPETESKVGEYYVTAKDYDKLSAFTRELAEKIVKGAYWKNPDNSIRECWECEWINGVHDNSCIVPRAEKFLSDNLT